MTLSQYLKPSRHVVLVLCIAFFVMFGYAFFIGRLTYLDMQLRFESVKDIYLETSLWRFGTVESIDIENGRMIVSAENRSYPNAPHNRLRVVLRDDTFIAKQELIREDSGVYVGLTQPTPASAQDLSAGTNVALLLDTSSNVGTIEALVVLFGSPL